MHQYRLREQLEHGDQARPWQLFTLGDVPGMVIPCHWHPEWELVVVERGALELTRNQSVERLGPGDAAFVTGTDLHGGLGQGPDLQVAALVFHSALLRAERRDAATALWIDPLDDGTLKVPEILRAGGRPAALAQALVDAARKDTAGMELAFKGLLFQFLAEVVAAGLVRRGGEAPTDDPLPRIRHTLQIIEERFAQPLTVEALADQAHLSPSHFHRVFKAHTGDTPIRHLIRRRIDEAERLLRTGTFSVTEVALRVGFTNFSHFSRTFQAHRGTLPSTLLRRPGCGIPEPWTTRPLPPPGPTLRP